MQLRTSWLGLKFDYFYKFDELVVHEWPCKKLNEVFFYRNFLRSLQVAYRKEVRAKRRAGCLPRLDSAGCCIARSGKLDRARSRLYRSQILQVNMRWKALAEIYTMHSFAPLWNRIPPLSNLKIFIKNY